MDFKKNTIVDARVLQQPVSYQIIKGALNVNSQKVAALTKSSTSQNYNITIPSLNVFVDRKIMWESEVVLKISLTAGSLNDAAAAGAGGNPAANSQLVQLGSDISLNSYPLHRMVSTISLTLNDSVVTTNLADTIDEQIYLLDTDTNEQINQTFPSYFGKYKNYRDGAGAHNNPIAGGFDTGDNMKPKNGQWFDVSFCNQDGTSLVGGANEAVTIDGVDFRHDNGRPSVVDLAGGNIRTEYKFCIKFRCVEPLMISPLQYTNEVGNSVGLYGINNMSLNINFGNIKNCISFDNTPLRAAGGFADVITNVEFASNDPFPIARLNMFYLTPPLDIKLSQNNIVPYYEFPSYKTNHPGLPIGSRTGIINSATITLPSIPDYLILAVKKTTYTTEETHSYLPIRKVNLTFDNRSGLLNTLDHAELYQMSFKNGLHTDYSNYRGLINVPTGKLESIGGFIIAKFGSDIELNAGQAPSVLGNYSLSLQVEFERPGPTTAATGNLQLLVITPVSGFHITQSGSSQVLKNLLTETDVLNSGGEMEGDDQFDRVFGGGFFSNLKSKFSNFGKSLMNHPMFQQFVDKAKDKAMEEGQKFAQMAKDKAMNMGKEFIKKKLGGRASYSAAGKKYNRKTKLSDLL